ncbi:MAG: DUF6691 family protein [Oceanococcus sp.]
MKNLIALISGVLFGLGLALSNMMDPAKVLNFLDLSGQWDPSLMLVMGGAIGVTLPGFWLVLKRPHPLLDKQFYVPDARNINASLLLGAAMFGVGWGLAGLCPGPAIAGLATGKVDLLIFVVTMLLGYRGMAWLEDRQASRGIS